ncbi:Maf-like protein [Clostridium botulinum]|uniref:dTTP/UTP pyrophosphatase n=2 Tax=Clostridiaceae TaxID=31979 RepID=A0A9P2LL71_CLOBO|nr:Maf-like protein [Clostridium novyi]EES91091.1 septum formation protein Maf [Clostridium botulinum D str. 1873]MCD3216122.1 Maf-like protein [Clostridium botulinum C]NFV46462.1 Maf-like protein [Clostridium botulinum]MCD3245096.1 Maf-like protein [Clostridium botulinum C]
MRIVLASASERRQELLQRITNKFEVIVSNFDENTVDFEGNFENYVMKLAKGKAISVAQNLSKDAVVIGCDTIVAFNGKVLGKPNDELEAFNMLKALSGNVHKVYSGIAVIDTIKGNTRVENVCTSVKFSSLTNEKIKEYISTKEPMDKAGAYGIQGFGGVFVEEINGDYYNVVGLSLNKLDKMLWEMGVDL